MRPNALVAAHQWLARKDRREHPDGTFDRSGQWYPHAEREALPCCRAVRLPSAKWPYSLMLHCRSREHVATLHGIDGETMRLALAVVAEYPLTAETVWPVIQTARRLGAAIETRAQIRRVAATQRQAPMRPEREEVAR